GSSATVGGARSFGSRTLTTAVVLPVRPSASVATATRFILPGPPAVTWPLPVASSVTGWPSRVRVTPVIGATLEARAWTVTAVPGRTGKLGVSTTVTLGGV